MTQNHISILIDKECVNDEVANPVVSVLQEATSVTEDVLRGWLKRARYYFIRGVLVYKVTSQGKLVRRTVFVGAKPEYFEITSAKLFDVGYHMLELQHIIAGNSSPSFLAAQNSGYEKKIDAERSCVISVRSKSISLIFMSVQKRRDFVFLIGVELLLTKKKYSTLTKLIAEQATTEKNS